MILKQNAIRLLGLDGARMSGTRPVVVYGASGFSARLIIEFLREYNVPFVAAGRSREKIEEVLAHVPGIGTADYEIVQVDARGGPLATLLEGATVVCNTVGPCIYYASTVAEAALKAGCHYIDTGGETPWVRLAHEEWGARFAEAGLLLAPATAYMSAVAEACARIAIERAPGIDSLEILSMFNGFPTYGSTQTIFGQLQWESLYLEQNEYKLWPPVTTLEVTIPSAITTQLALPWGGFPHPVWFKDHPQIANVRAFGGLLDRSLMESIVAGQRSYQENIKDLPPDERGECSPRSPTRCSPAAAAREPPHAAHGRRRRRARQPRHHPGVRPRPGRLPHDGPDPGLRRTPPRAPTAPQGRLRLTGRGVRPPRAPRGARGLRPRAGRRSASPRAGCRRPRATTMPRCAAASREAPDRRRGPCVPRPGAQRDGDREVGFRVDQAESLRAFEDRP